MTITVPRLNRLPAQERGITIADFLVPIRVAEGIGVRVRHLALILAGTLLIAAGGPDLLLPAGRSRARSPARPSPSCSSVARSASGAGSRPPALYLLLGVVGLPVFAEGEARLGRSSPARRAATSSASSSPPPSSVALPSSAGTGGSSARSGRCSSATRRSTPSACRGWR